jgi:hypothetical protein
MRPVGALNAISDFRNGTRGGLLHVYMHVLFGANPTNCLCDVPCQGSPCLIRSHSEVSLRFSRMSPLVGIVYYSVYVIYPHFSPRPNRITITSLRNVYPSYTSDVHTRPFLIHITSHKFMRPTRVLSLPSEHGTEKLPAEYGRETKFTLLSV